jgi:hypothetical protein
MIDRQIRNHHSDPIREDTGHRIGRQRQDTLALRRVMKPEPSYTISMPNGYVRQVGEGSVFAPLVPGGTAFSVGTCTCEGSEIAIRWNADKAGQYAAALHEAGKLVFVPGEKAGSLVAMLRTVSKA